MTRTVQFSEYGGTDVLKVVDTRPLTAGPGQVRLAMRAAGINPVDWKMMQGQMREMIPLTLPVGPGLGCGRRCQPGRRRRHSVPGGR